MAANDHVWLCNGVELCNGWSTAPLISAVAINTAPLTAIHVLLTEVTAPAAKPCHVQEHNQAVGEALTPTRCLAARALRA